MGGTVVSPLSEPGSRFVTERLLTSVREEVTRADTKASILLSGSVTLPTLAVSAADGRLGSGPLGVVGAVLWLAGIVMLTLVVLPRTRAGRGYVRTGAGAGAVGPGPSVTELHRGAGPEEVSAAVLAAGRDPGRWLLEQSCTLAAILAVKYRWMRWAVGCLVAGGAAVAATALG
ncbi:Pycsar system effector family protein [Streptomyces sp. NPDC059063]|uniref:Pycsar system effector family protein n=1 Tax=unclassified Streptomyces TaxID=2593676 RepID=UPI0036BB6B4D